MANSSITLKTSTTKRRFCMLGLAGWKTRKLEHHSEMEAFWVTHDILLAVIKTGMYGNDYIMMFLFQIEICYNLCLFPDPSHAPYEPSQFEWNVSSSILPKVHSFKFLLGHNVPSVISGHIALFGFSFGCMNNYSSLNSVDGHHFFYILYILEIWKKPPT